MQQEGVLKDRASYEIMRPEDVGLAESRIVLTARSGRGAFRHRLARLGLKTNQRSEDASWDRFLRIADTKPEVTDDDLRAIVGGAESASHQGQSSAADARAHRPTYREADRVLSCRSRRRHRRDPCRADRARAVGGRRPER